MKEFLGVSYRDLGKNKWELVWPSGLKARLMANTEEEIKAKIQEVVSMLET